ncbi:1-phosphofructokinase/tagatose 6-phosphate kinase [Sanguibacter gelidistatuariae]|uniref:1-phosphofructokinase/tagatose 6-phosphate kinase n=1 Tax=Sanguibacter gelidistatuariae TaxID=1814289 RepID=A0A1G6HB40_9MICO|nr:1-phosphofructokinase family hexose kinase [Sanguibacter gelidistatuariae]SDB90656.1 1-phosphofructokinase/tagatose 6-phosphate kinase [Sanguibacter gelidistatuariae]
MILTVTPNPALDVTYYVDQIRLGEVNRVRTTTEMPGGKGVNVARVLVQLGTAATCLGFLGGDAGETLSRLLEPSGVAQAWLRTERPTRRTVAVVDAVETTLFNEAGPSVDAAAWDDLIALMSSLVSAGDVVVVSGSMPPGTPSTALPAMIAAAHTRGARTLVDTSGPSLLSAAEAGATLLKPNDVELLEATGATDVVAGARELLERGAASVVVSCGARGLIAMTRSDLSEHGWQVRPAEQLTGNPTGAGDAAVAALAQALVALAAPGATLAQTLPAHLADAVALSGAAVLSPTAGSVDLSAYARMRALITVEKRHDAC